MLRGLNLIAVGGLVAAAVVVYDVKYSATYEAQKVARLNNEINQEREKIAALKAEWSVLSAPDRIQRLASKYLGMKPLPITHIGTFASLPWLRPSDIGIRAKNVASAVITTGRTRTAAARRIASVGSSRSASSAWYWCCSPPGPR